MSGSYMEELVIAWIGQRNRNAEKDAVVRLIQKTDAQFHYDEDLRQLALKLLQREFYRTAIAEKLSERADLASTPKKIAGTRRRNSGEKSQQARGARSNWTNSHG